jgi:predicted DNA-binding WGR domain protein
MTKKWSDVSAAIRSTDIFCAMYWYIGPNKKTKSGSSRKFWAIERLREGGDLQLRYGRIPKSGICDGGRASNGGMSEAEAEKRTLSQIKDGYELAGLRVDDGLRVRPAAALARPPYVPTPQTISTDPSSVVVSSWAKNMPPPFDRIFTLSPGGVGISSWRARDVDGVLICEIPAEEVAKILEEAA